MSENYKSSEVRAAVITVMASSEGGYIPILAVTGLLVIYFYRREKMAKSGKKISKMGYDEVLQEIHKLKEAGQRQSVRYAQMKKHRDVLVAERNT